jgi:MFS superfamily sulfate permease-like transporter
MLVTLALIVALPIETGMVLGIALAFVHGLFVVARPGVVQLARDAASGLWIRPTAEAPGEQVAGVLVLLIPAPLHFTNAHDPVRRLEAAVAHATPPVRTLVVEASSIIDIDDTGAQSLQDLAARLAGRGCRLVMAGLIAPRAVAAAAATGLVAALGPRGFYRNTADAVRDSRPGP